MFSDVVKRASSKTRRQSFTHSLLVIVLAFVVGIGLGIPGTLIMAILGFSLSPPSTWVLAATSVLQYVGFLLVVGGYLWYTDTNGLIRVRFPTLRDIIWMVGGLVGLFVAVYLMRIVITVIGAEQAQNTVVTQGVENPELFLLMIPITILFVGPGEELVFRGVVQGLFRSAFGAVPAILLASICFGFAHYIALTGSGKLTYIVVSIVLGVVLGAIYERTGNIVVPIVIHGLYNALLFAGQWVIAVNDLLITS